jgi:hypothetical protein
MLGSTLASNFTANLLAQQPALRVAADEFQKIDSLFVFHTQNYWNQLVNHVGEFGMFTWFFFATLVLIEIGGGGFYWILDQTHLFDRFKIQPKKLPGE